MFCFRMMASGFLLAALSVAGAHAATPVKVVLLGGQSNMLGFADGVFLPGSLKAPQSDVLFYDGSFPAASLKALAPSYNYNPTTGYFGPEITFGRQMADDHPADHYALIKYAVGGTSLGQNNSNPKQTWYPGSSNGVYADFKTTVANGLSALTAAGYTPEIVGMLWLQGENDSASQAAAAAYAQNLTSLITDVRSSYGANLPFVIGGIGGDSQTSMPYRSTVMNAQADVAGALTNVRSFSDDDLNPNMDLHFNGIVMQTIGQRFATNLETVPEPASLTLLAMGALTLMSRRRR